MKTKEQMAEESVEKFVNEYGLYGQMSNPPLCNAAESFKKGFLAGYNAAMEQLEQREREAFEAAMKAADDWHCKIDVWASRENPLHAMPIKLTYNDYKKSRGSRE